MIRNFRSSILPILVSGLLLLISSGSEAAVDATDFDFNGNGSIDPGKEAIAFFRHAHSSIYQQLDANKDGTIQPEERTEYHRYIEAEVEDSLVEYDQLRGNRGGITIAEVNSFFGTPAAKRSSFGGVLVRERHEDITVLQGSSQFRRAKGAILSFSRDISENENTWTMRGAILRPFRMPTGKAATSERTTLTSYAVVPSISLDRVNKSKNQQYEVDSLVFRLGTEFEVGGGGLFQLQYLRANLGYSTDVNLRSSVPIAEFQWEPVALNWGIGTSRSLLGGLMEYRFGGIMHAEIGTVLDAGEKTTLDEEDKFVRLGPKLKLELWPTAELLERVSLNVGTHYLWGFFGGPSTSHLWEAGLNFRLDESGHVQFQSEYRKGEVPLTNEQTETFLVGLGVKF